MFEKLMKADWVLWGRKEHEVERSMLAYGPGAGVLPMSSESLVEQGHRAVLAEVLLLQTAGVLTDA